MAETSRVTRHMLKATDDGSIEDYDKWISRGADISGTDKKGQNALHFLVKQGKFDMLQHVLNSKPEVRQLVNKVDNKDWSPFHLCCIQHPVELRTLELLLTFGADPTIENRCGSCKDLVDKTSKEFLQWRKRHTRGLPRDIRLLPNEYIVEYMRKFGHLDDDFTLTYDKMLEEGQVETADIPIVIAGPQGVGKTTLLYSLLGQRSTKTGPNPTKCIQVFPGRFTIELDDGTIQDHGHGAEYLTCLQQFVDNVLRRMEDSGVPKGQTWLKRHLSISSRFGQEVVISKQQNKGSSWKANLSIFDFSGDDVYEDIQHCFMTSYGIYILVFSLQQYPELTQMLCCYSNIYVLVFSLQQYPELTQMLGGIYTRLQHISLYHEDGKRPTVILVGTHLDKVPNSANMHEQIQAEITDHLKGHSDVGKYVQEHIKGVFLVYNSDLQQEAKDQIWKAVTGKPIDEQAWRRLVPGRWLALEREIIRYKDSGHKVMTLENVCAIAKEMAVPIQDTEQVKDAVRFMHKKKSILICHNPFSISSHDPIVVDTQWLVNHLAELLKVKQPYVSTQFVEGFLERDSNEGKPRNKNSFMSAISRLSLIAEPLPVKTENKASYYVVPCMLPLANKKLLESILDQARKSSSLGFVSNDKYIPPAFGDKLLASFISKMEVLFDPISRESLIYRHNACFVVNPGLNLALQCSCSILKLSLFTHTGSAMHDGIGNIIRQSVIDMFEDPKTFKCCLFNEDGSTKNFIEAAEDGSLNKNSVPLHQDLSKDRAVWFGQPQQIADIPSAGKSFDPKLDPELTPKRLSHVAKYIGNSYTTMFAFLGVQPELVEKERYQHRHLDFRSQLTKILLRWRALQKDRASLGKLIEAMKMNNLSHEEMLVDPVWTCNTAKTKVKDADAALIPGIDMSSSPSREDLTVVAGIVNSSFLVFFLELDVDYCDIQKAMELHKRQSERVLNMYLLELWGQRQGSKATFCRIISAMNETNLDTSLLKHINPRSSHC